MATLLVRAMARSTALMPPTLRGAKLASPLRGLKFANPKRADFGAAGWPKSADFPGSGWELYRKLAPLEPFFEPIEPFVV